MLQDLPRIIKHRIQARSTVIVCDASFSALAEVGESPTRSNFHDGGGPAPKVTIVLASSSGPQNKPVAKPGAGATASAFTRVLIEQLKTAPVRPLGEVFEAAKTRVIAETMKGTPSASLLQAP